MTRPDKSLADAQKLIAQANKLLKKNKVKKKMCKKCNEKVTAISGFCKECYDSFRKDNLENKIGTRWVSTDGYERIYDEDGNIKLYHRYLIEKSLRRKLDRTEKVMWKNGDRTDNRLENLLLSTERAFDFTAIICPHCSSPFAQSDSKNFLTDSTESPSNTTSPVVSSFTLSEMPDLRLDL